MKKNLRLALQTSGFVALFALAISGIPGIAQAENRAELEAVATSDDGLSEGPWVTAVPQSNEVLVDEETAKTLEALADTDDTAAVEILAIKTTDSKPVRKNKEEKWFKHLQKSLEVIQKNPASLKTVFNQLKDPAMLIPKAVNKIAALTNSDERRMELYKLSITPTSAAITVTAEDKTAFSALVTASVEDARKSLLQTRELLLTMLIERNFTYMSEKEIKEALKGLNPQRRHGHHGKHAEKKHKDGKKGKKGKKGKHSKKDKHDDDDKHGKKDKHDDDKHDKKDKHGKKGKKDKHGKKGKKGGNKKQVQEATPDAANDASPE